MTTAMTLPGTWGPAPPQLTADQEALVSGAAEDWVAAAVAAGPTDRGRAEDGVRRAYLAAGLVPPEWLLWFASPLAGAVAAAVVSGLDADLPAPEAVRDPLWARVRAELAAQGWRRERGRAGQPVRAWVGPLGFAEVRAAVQAQAGRSFWARAWGWTGHQVLRRLPWQHWDLQRDLLGGPVDGPLGWAAADQLRHEAIAGPPEAAWCATAEGIGRALPHLHGPRRLAGLGQVTGAVGWWWPFERAAVLTERPTVSRRDQQGRPHGPDGPAIAYRDGFAVHAWHGLPVAASLIERLPGLRVDDVRDEPNLTLRRIKMEAYGFDRYLRDAGAELAGRDELGSLWRLDQPDDEPLVMVEVVNATAEPDGTRASYWLRVPPDTRTAREAVAWTFGFTADTYRPRAET
jgi:hypothetical protein